MAAGWFLKMMFLRSNLFKFFVCSALVLPICAMEELAVVHSPQSVKFVSNEPVHSSYLADVFSAILGYTLDKTIKWDSLAPVNPLEGPEAIFVLDILGFENSLDLNLNADHFLLENEGNVDDQYRILSSRTEDRYQKKSVLLNLSPNREIFESKAAYPFLLKGVPASDEEKMEMVLNDPEVGQTIKDGTFNNTIAHDVHLLKELVTLKSLLSSMSSQKNVIKDGIPDIYWIKITGLRDLVDHYGDDSYQVNEGLRLLLQYVTEVKNVLKHIYDEDFVLAVITENDQPTPLIRKSRSLLQVSTEPSVKPKKPKNLADWNPNFHVGFALIAFTSIFLILTVFGVSVAIWNMDPGRDSIIYRMTSQRMKKD